MIARVFGKKGHVTAIVCDHCREKILARERGGVVWEVGAAYLKGEPAPCFHVHEKCSGDFAGEKMQAWEELDLHFLHLQAMRVPKPRPVQPPASRRKR